MKITNIPDIPQIPNAIFEAAKRGKLVVFIGAGVSRIIGCPSWKDYSLKVLKELLEKKLINYFDFEKLSKLPPRKLLTICEIILKENGYSLSELSNYFNGNEKLINKFKIYEKLYSFKAIYVTTNYDTHLDSIILKIYKDQYKKKNIKIFDSENDVLVEEDYKKSYRNKIIEDGREVLITDLKQGNVIHLHGSINKKDTMIVTISDYFKHYLPDSNVSTFLEFMFDKNTVLFVGYGLEEYEILEFIIKKSKVSKHEIKHFMLYPFFRQEISFFNLINKYYKELGVELIPYSIDKDGYESLVKVIDNWGKQIGPISREISFYDKKKLIDEVI